MSAPLIFLDTETCGLAPDDPIWEIGLIRREHDGVETEHHFFVEHPTGAADGLPDSFKQDHDERYDASSAWKPCHLEHVLRHLFRPGPDGAKAHVVGAVPNFDTERIERQFGHWGWHYHLIDVETLAVGWLAGRAQLRDEMDSAVRVDPCVPVLPWNSDELARLVGVDPARFKRHTALDDARWAKAIFEAVTS